MADIEINALPAVVTTTANMAFPEEDPGDSNLSKKVTLAQMADQTTIKTATGKFKVSQPDLTALTAVLTSAANTLKVAVNGGSDSETVTMINTNDLGSAVNTLTSTINGVADTAPIINTNDLSSAINTMTSVINGVSDTAAIVNSNDLASSVNTMTSTVNGIADGAPIINSASFSFVAGVLTYTVNGEDATETINGTTLLTNDPVNGVFTDTVPVNDALGELNDKILPYSQATGQTTDAVTPLDILSVVLPINSTVTLSGTVVAATSDHASAIGGKFCAMGQRGAGDISLVPDPTLDVKRTSAFSSGATFTVVADIATQTLNLRVNGESSKTFNWLVTFEYLIQS